jgi:hypothetical protein
MTEARWKRLGGVAGIAYVLTTACAAALAGARPAPGASSAEIRAFFVDRPVLLVAQGWLYALGGALLLWFAIAVRRVLGSVPAGRRLGDLFFIGTAVIVGVSLVAMSIQIVVVKAAPRLSPEAVRVVGFDFVLAQFLLSGFVVATAALAYAVCVITHGVLPRWTGWLAIVAAVLNVAGTFAVFVANGAFPIEGQLAVWLPGLSTVVWYLGTAIGLLRVNRRDTAAERALR